jgi:hypothetical protein
MLALDAFRRRHLDVRFRTRHGARARVVERPGLWMSGAEQMALVEDIRAVVRTGVPQGDLDYGVIADPETLKRAIITIIYDEETGKPAAFNALHVLECEIQGRTEEVLHLGLLMIDPAYRQQGLTGALYGITCFLISARRQMRPFWITSVTQVPLIFGIVGRFAVDVFPTWIPGGRRSFTHLQIARQLVTRHRAVFGTGPDAEFDEQTFVLRNAYTGGSDNLKKTFDEAPKFVHEIANVMCRDALDYDRGDDFVQVGKFTITVAQNYIMRSRDIVSPLFLVTQAFFLFGESFVAPLLQWLTPTRAMGGLRPARESEAAK